MTKKRAGFSKLMKAAAIFSVFILLICAVPQADAAQAMPEEIRTVTFVADGEVFATVQLQHGDSLGNMPKVPVKDGYTGTWSRTVDVVSEDATITAIYTPIQNTAARFDLWKAAMIAVPVLLISAIVVLLTAKHYEK